MPETGAILAEFIEATKADVASLHEAVCSFSGQLADADGDIGLAEHARQELALMVYHALLADCGQFPEYDLTKLPEWMKGIIQSYAPRAPGM